MNAPAPTRKLSILDIVRKIDIEILTQNSKLEPEATAIVKTLESLKSWIYEKYESGVSL
jgi:hypothetical protein